MNSMAKAGEAERAAAVQLAWAIKVLIRDIAADDAVGSGPGAEPGTVLDIDDESGILIACSEGSTWLREVQPAGRKRMGGAAFSRGARLTRGDRFA